MPSDLNSVNIVGRLTRDAETRMAGETVITSLRLGSSSRRKVAGVWADVSGYYDVTIFGGEGLVKYLVKGKQIAVNGRLSWREWEKDGVKRSAVEIVANDVQLLGGGDAPVAASSVSSTITDPHPWTPIALDPATVQKPSLSDELPF